MQLTVASLTLTGGHNAQAEGRTLDTTRGYAAHLPVFSLIYLHLREDSKLCICCLTTPGRSSVGCWL